MNLQSGKVLASIRLRQIDDADRETLCSIYASTREAERQQLGWPDEVWWQFVRDQFELQHAQYMRCYQSPSFNLIMDGARPVGRLYVDRLVQEIRVIDIALLPEYRRQGIGGHLLRALLAEAQSSGRSLGLHVERENPILDFYLRLGLRVEADRGVYLYMRSAASTLSACRDEALASPSFDAFVAQLASEFSLHLPDSRTEVSLRLNHVEILGDTGELGFSLLFSGAAGLSPVHETYEVSHPVLGCFPLFLGPVHSDASGEVQYQAIFNRLKPA